MFPSEVRPQRRNVERAELIPEIAVTVVVERENRFVSLKYPKSDEERIPGRLNKVSNRVADV
jgi:hypothetical protein